MRSRFFPPADEKSHPWQRRWLGSGRYWLLQIGGWGVFWVVLTLGSLTSGSGEAALQHELVAQTLLTFSLLICSHLLRLLVLFLRRSDLPAWGFLPGLMAATLATGAAVSGPWVYWTTTYIAIAEAPPEQELMFPYFVFLLGMTLLLAVWVALYFGYHSYTRYQQSMVEGLQLASAIKDAEVRALRAQINPHFLFNSLNTLRALIPRNLDRPREAITLLADMLRASLTVGHQRTITLAQELETVRNYLALEQLRFEERLRVHLDIEPATCTHFLPPFVLQTLVENALKFGVAPFEAGGEIHISTRLQNQALLLTVKNHGVLNTASSSTGLGLTNARSRLQLLCGPHATIALTQEDSWVVARLTIPQNLSPSTSLHS